jgi:hypothetical protein
MTRKTEGKQSSVIPAFVDRIENDIAVILLSDAPEIHFNLPLQYLPPNITEGDHLKLTFALDAESKEATRYRIAALQAELSSESETNIKL